eukprot:TRINITY_DN22577_c0_g2_i1.p1 TRINITY_DN22577_c0_g2~~TRINITY_DN22577_c0_g2_i1.p1  ORF type:complete len:287 (-),score=-8.97 TRINITY_DN22577_c0_g2_i1:199-1059(-)
MHTQSRPPHMSKVNQSLHKKTRIDSGKKSRKKSMHYIEDLNINLPATIKISPTPFSLYENKDSPHTQKSPNAVSLDEFEVERNDMEEMITSSEDSKPTIRFAIMRLRVPQVKQVIIKKGWLQKKKKSILQNWSNKYCVLTSESFVYYNSQDCARIKGCLRFSRLTCRTSLLHVELNNYLKISVKGSNRDFIFKAKNVTEIISWAQAIHLAHSNYSTTRAPQLSNLPSRDPKFWKVLFAVTSSTIGRTKAYSNGKQPAEMFYYLKAKASSLKYREWCLGADSIMWRW